jgi:hypothetical protein
LRGSNFSFCRWGKVPQNITSKVVVVVVVVVVVGLFK